jgi:chromosome segregation ATPase
MACEAEKEIRRLIGEADMLSRKGGDEDDRLLQLTIEKGEKENHLIELEQKERNLQTDVEAAEKTLSRLKGVIEEMEQRAKEEEAGLKSLEEEIQRQERAILEQNNQQQERSGLFDSKRQQAMELKSRLMIMENERGSKKGKTTDLEKDIEVLRGEVKVKEKDLMDARCQFEVALRQKDSLDRHLGSLTLQVYLVMSRHRK